MNQQYMFAVESEDSRGLIFLSLSGQQGAIPVLPTSVLPVSIDSPYEYVYKCILILLFL